MSLKSALVFCLSVISIAVSAQNFSVKVERNQRAPLAKSVNLSDTSIQDWDPFVLTVRQGPKQDGEYRERKGIVNERRKQHQRRYTNDAGRALPPPAPVMLNNYIANNAQSIPNDNHMAISNDGKVVSVVNTNLRVYNETGGLLLTRSLSAFAAALGVLQSISDPRVLYDPVQDRFIAVFFAGNTSAVSKIIVAFSKTNDPTGTWNFYTLKGNYLNDTTWSDYPIITASDKDFFMTFNQLKDSTDWKTGFRYSVIWQIDKTTGYNGDSLQLNYWHNIEYNGKPIWNVCPVQGGSLPSGPETYFVSVRPHDLSNDSVFLHTISSSYQSGNPQFGTKVLKTDIAYGLPPDALQKDGQYLATNDARVLAAFYENGNIQYVQNTVDTNTMTSSVYLGHIANPSSATPVVTGQIISNDTIDFGYPSIAYVGNNSFDNRAMITCSASPNDTFPGTVAFYRDANGMISEMLVVKHGRDAVNQIFNDSTERWGDYTGIQRKYNEPNTAWLSGAYTLSGRYSTWVAKVLNTDSVLVSSIAEAKKEIQSKVFPNPATEKFSIEIDLPGNNFTQFALYDVSGKLVRILLEDKIKSGTGIFSFNTQYLAGGIYFIKISDNGNLLRSEKIVISR